MARVRGVGRMGVHVLTGVGTSGIFLLKTLARWPRVVRSFPFLIKECFFVGVLSLPIVVVSALFIGMVVALQGFNVLNKFSAVSELGQLVACHRCQGMT